nr:putative reverse transcriptase, RNA-dependent DNA polymerase [Tanacetum cinerariifolium]
MTDLGPLNYFLGISVTRDSSGLFLSQKKYVVEILDKAHMVNCNPSQTPINTESKLGNDDDPIFDPTLYRSLVGSLQYLTFTRPDISYAVQHSSKRQPTLSRSSAKAEYRGVANAVTETCWLRNLLLELHTLLSSAMLVYCDNVSAVCLFSNPVQHQRTKHIEIDIHFVRDLVAVGHVRVLHVPSRYQHGSMESENNEIQRHGTMVHLCLTQKEFSYCNSTKSIYYVDDLLTDHWSTLKMGEQEELKVIPPSSKGQ